MQLLFHIATIVSVCLVLSKAAIITTPNGQLLKRQDQIAAVVDTPPAVLEAPVIVDTPPVEDIATPDTSAQSTSEDIIKGDATACGKKVQSEKPSDPAGEFLKCYMSGGL